MHNVRSLLMEETKLPALQQEKGRLEARMEDLLNAQGRFFAALDHDDKRINQRKRYESLDFENQYTLRHLCDKI